VLFRSGTALNDAAVAALDMTKTAKNVPMIIFLTDGNPTIGEQNVDTILKNAKEANKNRCRMFVFGVGYDLNTKLLDLMAEQNHGAREYVTPKEDIEVKVSNLYSKVSNPVLSDLKLEFSDVDVAELYPRDLPDLFQGVQLAVLGRFKKAATGTVKLVGKVGDETKTFTYSVKFGDTKADDYLPRMWALRAVAFMLDEIRLRGEKKELVDEITRLGKLHGILTPYTSFLVVEEGAPIPVAMRRELEQAAREARLSFAEKADGAAAVHDSADLARAKAGAPSANAPGIYGLSGGAGGRGGWRGVGGEAGAAEYDKALRKAVADVIHTVGGKTFYAKDDGFWVDGAFDKKDEAKAKDVKLWSDEFFALVKKYPELGKYVAASMKLIVVLDGEVYRIQ
jgi:Ca-activated chloride channel family protein